MLVPSMTAGWGKGRATGPAKQVALFGEGRSEGKREALRQFLHSTLQPFGDMIADEARHKLATPVRFGFDRLYAADIQGRARAFKSLVDGGMDAAEAARVTGLGDACSMSSSA